MSGFLHGCNLEICFLVFVGSVVFWAVRWLGLLNLLGVFWGGVVHVLTYIGSIGAVGFLDFD